MLNYILEVSICWLVFYMLYVLLLSKQTFFAINRWYLLSTLIAGLLIPLIVLPPMGFEANAPLTIYLEPISIGVQQVEMSLEEIVITQENRRWDFAFWLTCIYYLVCMLLSIRFGYGLWQIYRLREQGKHYVGEG
ncbi:MAG: hypothetical protein AAGD05_10410, partial [Bacteroidota bacterium]